MNPLLLIFLLVVIPIVFSGVRNYVNKKNSPDGDNGPEDGVLARFPGGIVEYYRFEPDIHRLVLKQPQFKKGETEFELKEIKGIRKTVIYKIPLFHNSEPVYNYYHKEMLKAGFEIKFSAVGEEKIGKPDPWFEKVFLTDKNVKAWKDLMQIMRGPVHCYIAGYKKDGNRDVYASVFSVNHFRNNRKTGVFVFISEV